MALCRVLGNTPNSAPIAGMLEPSLSMACARVMRSSVSLCPWRGTAGRKKPPAPSSRSFLQHRFTVISGTPKARAICPCEAVPLEMS